MVSFAQESKYYNKFFIQINDIELYKPLYFSQLNVSNEMSSEKFYSMDSILVKETITKQDKSNSSVIETGTIYNKEGNIIQKNTINKNSNHKYTEIYNTDGKLTKTIKSVGPMIIEEAHFDNQGKVIPNLKTIEPEPYRGRQGWNEYIGRHLKYPKDMKKNGVEGTVNISFNITENGDLTDIELINPEDAHPSLNEEALRVIKNYPHKWTPAMLDGKPIVYNINMPIRFKLGA